MIGSKNVFIIDDYDEHDETNWKEVIDSEELVRILLERNSDHLRQSTSDGTPFASGPLKELFGLYGMNEVADKILAGTLDIASLKLSDEVAAWLKELAYDNYTPPDPFIFG